MSTDKTIQVNYASRLLDFSGIRGIYKRVLVRAGLNSFHASYSNLQMGKPWFHFAIYVHSELCTGIRRLLRTAKARPEPCHVTTVSLRLRNLYLSGKL